MSLRLYRAVAGGAALVLAFGLAACAPEPGSDAEANNPFTGSDIKNADGSLKDPSLHEPSWPETTFGEDEVKQVELPAGFPSTEFLYPADAVIDNTGERGTGVWYLVFRSASAAEASDLWLKVIEQSGFTEHDPAETPEGGRAATLLNGGLEVLAVTLPQDDGSVLVSYDIRKLM